MVCIAPKGMLPRALVRNGSVALHDLVDHPGCNTFLNPVCTHIWIA